MSRVAKFDCIPLTLPVIHLLVPYGAGSLSSMVELATKDNPGLLGGVPKGVYQSLRNRLKRGGRVPVISLCPSMAEKKDSPRGGYIGNLGDEIALALLRRSEAAAASSVLLDQIRGLVCTSGRVRLGPGTGYRTRQLSTSIAWCFQDWWGKEVCVTLVASKIGHRVNSVPEQRCGVGDSSRRPSLPLPSFSPSPDDCTLYWSGWLEIQCDDVDALSVIVDDAANFIDALTGGVVKVCHDGGTNFGLPIPSLPPSLDCPDVTCTAPKNVLFPLPDFSFPHNAAHLHSNVNSDLVVTSASDKLNAPVTNALGDRYSKKRDMRDFMLQKLDMGAAPTGGDSFL
jgi:hypothetical protein